MGLHITRSQYANISRLIGSVEKGSELEVRIAKPIDTFSFQRVIAYYTGLAPQGVKVVKQDEVLDISSDAYKGVRISVQGLSSISSYCKNGVVLGATGIRKTRMAAPERIDEHNLVIKLSDESPIDNPIDVSNLITSMKSVEKFFRMKKRTSFIMDSFRIDCTLVRSRKGKHLSTSALNLAPTDYEIEIEYIPGDTSEVSDSVARKLLSIVSEVLKVMDDSEYLMPASHTFYVLKAYHWLAFGGAELDMTRLYRNPKSIFIGPQPISLELRNLLDPDLAPDSIKRNYTVTHKADGERSLVFVDANGNVFLINNRMVVRATRLHCPSYAHSIFDSEIITKKNGVRSVMLFDAYFAKGICIASLPLERTPGLSCDTRMDNVRGFISAVSRSIDPRFEISAKQFKVITSVAQFKKETSHMLGEQKAGALGFNTDGLIFTPLLVPVGALLGTQDINLQGTWTSAFKWKPPHDNTIDFLVRVRRLPKSTQDEVVRQPSGLGKVLDLYVRGNITNATAWDYSNNIRSRSGSMPVRFEPVGVEDVSTVNSMLVTLDEDGFIRCLNREVIYDESIVECTWNGERWLPMRIRVDKTELYKATRNIGGAANDKDVAERVWRTIINPITESHLTGATKVTLDMIAADDSKYYANNGVKRDKTNTIHLANFHNLWVKSKHLISRFCDTKNDSLMDFGCGKGGDLNKWIEAGFTKVMGLDLFSDNINNPQNGIYRRLADVSEKRSKYSRKTHSYLFLPFDVSQRITKETINAMPNDQERLLAQVAFGYTAAPTPNLKYLENLVGNGFDVVSSQFAIHYFFKNDTAMGNFVANLDKCLRPGGYFIGTCFDGETVARALAKDELIKGEKGGRLIWSIQRKFNGAYDPNAFGQTIKVYMESINQYLDEYLVDFNLLKSELAKVDVHVLNVAECQEIGLEKSDGLFGELFNDMLTYVESKRRVLPPNEQWMLRVIDQMSDAEKRLSFMNRWFVFKKAGTKKESPQPVVVKKRVIKKRTTPKEDL